MEIKKIVSGIKAGYKTTEFWAMVSSIIFGLLVASGKLSSSQPDKILEYINNIMGSGVTLVTTASYILSRGKAKSKETSNVDYTKLLEDIKYIVDEKNKTLI